MHIAVCIDNPGNRKQMERLLHRASDKQTPENVFYIDSYGSMSAVMTRPKLYDLFLLDIVEAEANSLTLAFMLRSAGVTCPIVLCPYDIDYRSLLENLNETDAQIAASFLFLDQPVKVEELDAILAIAQDCANHAIPTMELRGDKYTIYAREEEFLYALQEKERIHIWLTNDRQIRVFSQARVFYQDVKNFQNIYYLSNHCLVHKAYIAQVGAFSVTLKNNLRIPVSHKIAVALKAELS